MRPGPDAGTPQPIGLPPIPVPTMGRYGPLRLKPEVTYRGEGEDAIATVRTPGDGLTFTIHAEDWRRVVMMFGGAEMPAVFLHGNARGKRYVALTMPPGIGEAKGEVMHVARLLFSTKDLRGLAVRYRDGNRQNLTMGNLHLKGQRETAEEAGAL